MSIFRYFLLLFLPAFVFASFDDFHVRSFADYFRKGMFNESLQILEDWEISEQPPRDRILGMKSAVYLAMGDLEKSRIFMDECAQNLKVDHISDPLLSYILQMYYRALEDTPEDLSLSGGLIRLCKQEQPKGVKLKYWFGVGQILVGVLAAPFSAGTSTALILSGAAMVVDAASDALNNKENWEKDLNERQRINPDIQNNSFFKRSLYGVPNAQLV